MGEAGQKALRVDFDRAITLEFHGAGVSSDAGLFPYRDLDDAAQLTESGAGAMFDDRTGSNIQHNLTALLRQSVYSRLAGYEDVNDADRLSVDPVMRHVVGGRATGRQAASTSQMARFETEVLTQPENLSALRDMPGRWVDLVQQRRPVNLLHSEGSALASAPMGLERDSGRLQTQLSGRFRSGSPGARAKMGLMAGQGCVILVSDEPGSGAGQGSNGKCR